VATIPVKFGGDEFPNVTSVAPADSLSTEILIDAASLRGMRTRRISIAGFVKKPPKLEMLKRQRDLVELMAAKGNALVEYPGCASFTGRIVDITWEDWAGGPVARYRVEIAGEVDNPFAAGVTVAPIGGSLPPITLDNPSPAVGDAFERPSDDDRPSASLGKRITVSGLLAGTPAESAAAQAALKALLTDQDSYTVTISSGAYVARVQSFTFDSPGERDGSAPRTYQIEFSTLTDFTLEEESLRGGPFTIAGITFDVATSFSHNIGRDASGGATSESVNVSGIRFFASIAECDSFRDTVNGYVESGTSFVSNSGKTLRLQDASWSEAKRDGHYVDGTARYSISFSVGFQEGQGGGAAAGGGPAVILGVAFQSVDSRNYGASIDAGVVSSENQSASGKVSTAPAVRPGDLVAHEGKQWVVTSLSTGAFDEDGLSQVSVSGQTLDSAAAAEQLYPDFFEGFFLNHVASRQKSVNYGFDQCVGAYVASSINSSVSGFRLDDDGGVLNLIQTINRFLGQFIITSVSTSAPELVEFNGATQKRIQISISGTLNIREGGGDCEAEDNVKFEEERSIEDATARYNQVTIPGKGITYKKVGMDPATEEVTVRNVARLPGIFRTMGYPADPNPSIGTADTEAVKISRRFRTSGLSKEVTVKFQRFDAVDVNEE